jgi:hypothetical protein
MYKPVKCPYCKARWFDIDSGVIEIKILCRKCKRMITARVGASSDDVEIQKKWRCEDGVQKGEEKTETKTVLN